MLCNSLVSLNIENVSAAKCAGDEMLGAKYAQTICVWHIFKGVKNSQ